MCAFENGYKAFERGDGEMVGNPYRFPSREFTSWVDGYQTAKAVHNFGDTDIPAHKG
jgi:hypothetical protein